MNKHELDGHVDKAKGKAKEAIGVLTGDGALKNEGKVDKAIGRFEVAVGKTERKTGDVIDKLGKALKD